MDNLIEFSTQGVVIWDSDQIELIDNEISSNKDDGLWVMDSQRVLVKNNNLNRNGGNGTRIHESNMIQFIGNEFAHNAEFGILTQKIESIILCKDNKLAENGRGDYGLGSFVTQELSKDLQMLCEGKQPISE
jgi:parallel beta-helix repeat protein